VDTGTLITYQRKRVGTSLNKTKIQNLPLSDKELTNGAKNTFKSYEKE
jgi:hypothetical protein